MIYLTLASAPVLGLLLFIYLKDKYEKEPLGLCLKMSLFGAIAVAPIFVIELFLSWIGKQLPINATGLAFWDAFVVAGMTEETFKFLVIYLFIWRNKNFNEPFDGIVYAVFASLGFALVENILYVFNNGIGTGLIRAFTAVPAHTIFGITMGYFFALAKFSKSNNSALLLTALLLPVLIHGLYDFILMQPNKTLLLIFIPYLIVLIILAFRMMKSQSNNSPFKNKTE